jgi:D-alanyl-D-alanine carboxypeptidase/D-alanyl-D-alanine-endopeptidase (penicillin-binding protein 4)
MQVHVGARRLLLTVCFLLNGARAADAQSALPAQASLSAAAAQSQLAEKIAAVICRPEFRHAEFGIEFYSLDTNEPIYTLNVDKLFTPASTTKLLTEGAALELLGPDYRFHTRVYGTGSVDQNGVLHGDLVLVASGDPNLSGRIQPDGTLAFENEDHSYDGSPDTRAVPGDPLLVIRELAVQVASRGVKSIEGRVLVDTSLFPEGEMELGTHTVVSPVVVNDNVVDVILTPGAEPGSATAMAVSPATAYVTFTNLVKTAAPGSKTQVKFDNDVTAADGSHSVDITGTMPAGKPILFAYSVKQPGRFAEIVLRQALAEQDIALTDRRDTAPNFAVLAASYTPDHLLAEHVSPPLSEEVKVTLKVSQNLHASLIPYLLGAVLAHRQTDIAQAGFDLEHDWLAHAGLDLSGAAQGDGAGAASSAFFTPAFMVSYLAYMARQKHFNALLSALPVLGRDGTLWNIQTQAPAAGQVHAKTGTYDAYDNLNRRLIVTGKGLAGYFTTARGQRIAFAIYANHVAVPDEAEAATRIVGQALGEIAAAAYLASQTEGQR